MNDLSGMDIVPEPKIIIASLHACCQTNVSTFVNCPLHSVLLPSGSRSSEDIVDLSSSQTCNMSFFPKLQYPFIDSLWHDECKKCQDIL